MSKLKILKNTASYHDEFIETLKQPQEVNLYLRIALGEYQHDHDAEALLVALNNIKDERFTYS